VVAGATSGAVAGALVAALVSVAEGRSLGAIDAELLGIGAMFGAPLGAVLLPVAAWLLMRYVPLGQALAATLIGTVGGGVAGWFLPVGTAQVSRTLLGGGIGFALGVGIVRGLTNTRRGANPSPPRVTSDER
jgi:hypothetical protein